MDPPKLKVFLHLVVGTQKLPGGLRGVLVNEGFALNVKVDTRLFIVLSGEKCVIGAV